MTWLLVTINELVPPLLYITPDPVPLPEGHETEIETTDGDTAAAIV